MSFDLEIAVAAAVPLVASGIAGGIAGYHAGHGQQIQPGYLDAVLAYGPVVGTGALGVFASVGYMTLNGRYSSLNSATAGLAGGAIGATAGGICQAAGFGVGYMLSRL